MLINKKVKVLKIPLTSLDRSVGRPIENPKVELRETTDQVSTGY